MLRHGLVGWEFRWTRSTDRNGVCQYPHRGRPGVIRMSLPLAMVNGYEPWYIDGIALHEIAHALLPGHQHDEEWVALNKKLGGIGREADPRERHSRWMATCPRCTLPHGLTKTPSVIVQYSCSKCGTDLAFIDTLIALRKRPPSRTATSKTPPGS